MRVTRQPARSGIALIIVMLVIAALSILAAGFAYSMKVEMRLAQNLNQEPEMLWLGRSGVELARYVLAQEWNTRPPPRYEALSQKWAGGLGDTNELLAWINLDNVELGPGRFSVRIEDLERRVNVNIASRELLERALELLGVEMLDQDTVVDSIEDWRDRDFNPQLNGAESEYYLSRPQPYVAKDGPFDDVSELLLVQGVTPALYFGPARTESGDAGAWPGTASDSLGWPTPSAYGLGLVDLFTTLGRQININTAPAAVLQLLPGVDENMANAIIQHRAGPDGMDGTEDDTPFYNVGELINVGGVIPQFAQALGQFAGVRSLYFQAHIEVEIGQYRRTYVALLWRRSPRDVLVLSTYWE